MSTETMTDGQRGDWSLPLPDDYLVVLTEWMARNGYSAMDVAYAVEKPWKYLDELAQARAESAS